MGETVLLVIMLEEGYVELILKIFYQKAYTKSNIFYKKLNLAILVCIFSQKR